MAQLSVAAAVYGHGQTSRTDIVTGSIAELQIRHPATPPAASGLAQQVDSSRTQVSSTLHIQHYIFAYTYLNAKLAKIKGTQKFRGPQ